MSVAVANEPHIVIVGAGFGGQGVCHGLKGSGRVTVIDARDSLSIGATWHYQLKSAVPPSLTLLSDTLGGRAGQLLTNTTVSELDTGGKSVTLGDGTVLNYDYLVLSPGVVSDSQSIPGLEQALDITCLESFPAIKQQIHELKPGDTVHIAICKCPYSCPPFPFELAFLIDELLRGRGLREQVRIVITCPVPWPFGGPMAEKLFKSAMEAKGVEYHGNAVLKQLSCDQGLFRAQFDGDVAEIVSQTVLASFPHRAPDFCKDLVNPKGFVSVDLQTNRVTKVADMSVFCVGDACHAVMPAVGAPIPKAGEFGWQAGVAVGEILNGLIADPCAPPVLPTSRMARCIVDAGFGNGIVVQPDFSAAINHPAEGKPKMAVESVAGGHHQKVDFVNYYLGLFTGGEVQECFATKEPMCKEDPTWALWN